MTKITKEQVQLANPNMDILDEIFRPVKGFEGVYLISNYGNLVSLHEHNYGKYLKFGGVHKSGKGYRSIMLYNGDIKQTLSVHRVVAEAFIPNPEGKPVVNHKDTNKLNNYVGNLEWVTYGENNRHAISKGVRNPKFDEKSVALSSPVLILETGEAFKSYSSCDRYLNKPCGYVSGIINKYNGFSSALRLHFQSLPFEQYVLYTMGMLTFEPKVFDESEYLNTGVQHRGLCVRVVETGECFACGCDCDKKYGLTKGTTSDIIHRRKGYYPKLDLHFETISKEAYLTWKSNPIVKEPMLNIDEQFYAKSNRYRFCVKVIETGECFPTGSECDRHYGFSKGFTALTISKYGGHRKRASAYHFVKISAEEYLEYVRSQSNK